MKAINVNTLKKLGMDVLFDIIGGTLYAAGIYSFASQAQFAPGGITGIALIINHYTDLPIGIGTLLLNIPVVLLCLKTLGKRFLLLSVKTMVISTVIMDFVFPMLPAYTGDSLMAALFAGALSGAGLALIYWRGSSTGGTDFLILSMRKKKPHLSIGTISVVTDGCVILLGGLVFGRIDAVLQGIVMTAVSTIIIDKITNVFTNGQIALIVTSNGEAISKTIMRDIGRGVTSVNATGMFSGADRRVLICACSRAEACRIRGIAYRADKKALVVLCPYDTAYGLGFLAPAD
ncbi:MAG: YitT family protein [Clostridia bacterium]|nr:YitT family protein [Clostridia bacterium]